MFNKADDIFLIRFCNNNQHVLRPILSEWQYDQITTWHDILLVMKTVLTQTIATVGASF